MSKAKSNVQAKLGDAPRQKQERHTSKGKGSAQAKPKAVPKQCQGLCPNQCGVTEAKRENLI